MARASVASADAFMVRMGISLSMVIDVAVRIGRSPRGAMILIISTAFEHKR
jgi:hypothetical protein